MSGTRSDEVVVQADRLVKSFDTPAGPLPVLAGVELNVHWGEVVAVAGRSGSGKTTLLTILAGWDAPDAGSVQLFGAKAPATGWRWTDLALLPQSLGLLEELTVAENVVLPTRLAMDGQRDDPNQVMDRLGVGDLADRAPSEISLGEQQRTALARAVLVRPRLLLADEPVSHQNVEWAELMMVVLRELAADGTTCLIATHNQVAFAAADRVLELQAGRLRPFPV